MTTPTIQERMASRNERKTQVLVQIAAVKKKLEDPSFAEADQLTSMVGELEATKSLFTTEHFSVTDLLKDNDPKSIALHDEADKLDAVVSSLYQSATNWLTMHAEEELSADLETDASDGLTPNSEDADSGASALPAPTMPLSGTTGGTEVLAHQRKQDTAKVLTPNPHVKTKDSRTAQDSRYMYKAVAEIKEMMVGKASVCDRLEQMNADKDHLIKQKEAETRMLLLQIKDLERRVQTMQPGEQNRGSSTPAKSPAGRSVTFEEPNVSNVLHTMYDHDPQNLGPYRSNVPYSRDTMHSNVTTVTDSRLFDNVAPPTDSSRRITLPNLLNDSGSSRRGREPSGFVSNQGVYHNRSRLSQPAVSAHLDSSQGGSEASLLASLMTQNNTLVQSFLDDSKAMYQTQRECTEMPKSKLQVFDGNPLNYWTFMKAFEDLVGGSSMRDAKKLNSLITHVSEDVKKLLTGCQLMTASVGYAKACSILKERYGNPFLISQAWKSKISSYPKISSAELLELYSEDLTCCYNTLFEMGHVAEFENSDCLSAIAAKLENHLRGKWRRVHRAALKRDRSGTFKELVELIIHASEEMNDPVYNNSRLDSLVSGFAVAPMRFNQPGSSKEQKKSRQAVFSSLVEFPDSIVHNLSDEDFNQQILLMATEVASRTCAVCSGPHYLSDCSEFSKLTPRDRLATARKKRLCLLCLNAGHFIDACPHKHWKCQVRGCEYRHHNLLHGAFNISNSSGRSYSISNSAAVEKASSNLIDLDDNKHLVTMNEDADICINATAVGNDALGIEEGGMGRAVLPIVAIIIHVGKQSMTTYALLDPGSTASICTQRVVTLLQPKCRGVADLTINTVSGKKDMRGMLYSFEVRSCDSSELLPLFEVVAFEQLPISSKHITAAEDLKRFPHLSHLPIVRAELQHVDFLIGQDNAHLLKPQRTIEGRDLRDPFAVVTPLGYTIYGLRRGESSIQRKEVSLNCIELEEEEKMDSLEQIVSRFWSLDQVPQASSLSAENRAVVQRWDDRMKLVNGHIQLPIPLKSSSPDFPNNRPVVLARLRSLGRRLLRNPQLHKMYAEAMAVNFQKGYARQVYHTPTRGNCWYLTQLPVEHKRKPGVARPVWNGSFEFRGRSLNAEVHQGPDLTNRIVAVMTNFRLLPVAVMGDVKAMYNQVKVPVEQQDLMRFLYWEGGDPNNAVIDCCLDYHMFGGGWSPSVCTYALRKSVQIAKIDPNGEVARTILKAFYVDDCVKSVVDVRTGIELFTEVITVLHNVHFDFTKLVSNRRELTEAFPEEKRAVESVDLDFDGGRVQVQHSLGQRWQPGRDLFCFIACFQTDPATRRELLSTLSTLYDPLGLCAPFIIPAKRMLQELSKRGLSWDDELPSDVREQWTRWVTDAQEISSLEIPRWTGMTALDNRVWLIHFCDASEVAYGDACYLCVINDSDIIVDSNLLASRSRLAPMKSQSIPRLELCAAVVAAQLDEAIRGYLDVKPEKSMFWSDSTLVLRYLHSEPSRFRTFVANRISVIQQLTNVKAWHHVPTELNPADILSRGVGAKELVEDEMWLVGPAFLKKNQSEWPPQPDFLTEDVPDLELKRVREIYVTEKEDEVSSPGQIAQMVHGDILEEIWDRSSSWRQVLRRVAWLLRAVKKFRIKRTPEAVQGTSTLDAKELDLARKKVIGAAQTKYLSSKEVNSASFRKLFPKTREGLLCVGGRLIKASLPSDFKQPYVMAPGNRPTDLLIIHCHNQVHHAGVTRTLMEVRKFAWILTGRKAVNAVVRKCLMCKKYKAGPMSQVMADLPAYRLQEKVRPFSYVGIDYMGPLLIKVGRSLVKRYVCVIVCSVTRAIHLEPATELTSSSFLNAFSRFSARRGKPLKVLSDNGTNFVGAKGELDRETTFWNNDEVARHCADEGIEWAFNPPAASHFGGMWERHIRTIRSLMLFMTGGITLQEEAFQTLLCLIEGALNSRPLTKLTDNPDDPSPITPNQLLQGKIVDPIRGIFFKGDTLRKTWKQAQRLADEFWKRWTLEYLSDLQKRTKWTDRRENLTEGSLVLVVQDTLPRQMWPLGLVKKTFAGGDGCVRAAEVKTATSVLTRPIVKLVLLEADLVQE